jgi:diadenosine tetraphosphate (Ap4A) HIT family hydrolase
MSTVIHEMVERCRSGAMPTLVARLASGWAVLGERQVLPGYCLLLQDPVVADLNALGADARGQFLADMARIGDVQLRVLQAVRINYAIFGNIEPALHAHVFPRRADELAGQRTLQPFALDWNAAPLYTVERFGAIQAQIAAALAARC